MNAPTQGSADEPWEPEHSRQGPGRPPVRRGDLPGVYGREEAAWIQVLTMTRNLQIMDKLAVLAIVRTVTIIPMLTIITISVILIVTSTMVFSIITWQQQHYM